MHIAIRAATTMFVVAALLGATTAARAQAPGSVADSLLQRALTAAQSGDTSAAIDMLERVNKVAPLYAPAFYHRGVMISRGTKLGMSDILRRRTAWNLVNRAHELDPRNPFYLMELGRLRLKTPFLRLDAERLFKKALDAAIERKDPRVLADIYWELGQIHERRYITMAHRRIITGASVSFDTDNAMENWHYTGDFLAQTSQVIDDAGELDYRKAEDRYRAALTADATHVGAALGLLGLLYDGGRYEEMAQLAGDVRQALPRQPRLALAQALALHRLDRPVDAAAAFEEGIALLDPSDRSSMLGLEQILRREQAESYARLAPTERAAMDSTYWNVADPLKLTSVNEARLEFLARVTYADLRFGSAEFRTRGWETDRGVVYIRYGPPPVIATFSPETAELDDAERIGRVTYVWYYPETKLRFVFIGPPAMNYAFFAGDFRSYTENARHVAPVRWDNMTKSGRVDSIPVQVARFRADSGIATELSVFADIPVGRMLQDVEISQVALETGLFVTDSRRRDVTSRRDTIITRAAKSRPEMPRVWRQVLKPGDYVYRVESREQASGRSARALAMVDIADFPSNRFALSDVLVAERIEPRNPALPPRGIGDYLIVPNAAMTFGPRDTVYLYWEVYGATGDTTGVGRLEVSLSLTVSALDRGRAIEARILGGIADVTGLSAKGDERVALRYDRTVAILPGNRIPNHLAVDIGEAPYGTYTLELTVRDLVSGATATTQRILTLPRP